MAGILELLLLTIITPLQKFKMEYHQLIQLVRHEKTLSSSFEIIFCLLLTWWIDTPWYVFCFSPVETTVKVNRVKTEMVSHREAQDFRNNDVPSYLDLSQQLLAVWGSSTDKKLGSGAISKLLMRLPSEITQKLLTDINSSGVSLYDVKDCTPEAEKVSRLYLALTKVLVQLCIYV